MKSTILWLCFVLSIGMVGCSKSDPVELTGTTSVIEDPFTPESFKSPGCGLSGAISSANKLIHMEVDGKDRTYRLTVPQNYDSNNGYPLIFAFHFLGGNSMLSYMSYGFWGVAEDEAIIVYPDGVTGECGGIPQWEPTDLAFFDALYDAITSEYCVDEGRVFATGLSAGAYMTNLVGCERGDVLRAIVPVAGAGP